VRNICSELEQPQQLLALELVRHWSPGRRERQVSDHPYGATQMTVYYIGTYDIDDFEKFKRYPQIVTSLLSKYGGEVLTSDTQAYVVEGTGRTMNAIIRFPSREAALGLYNDPAYQEGKRIRQESTSNVSMVIAEEFVAPTGDAR
jgi:uncharacterized protein (DUF1330 family)